jgi:beta-lactam-binding protein with PASTA domain
VQVVVSKGQDLVTVPRLVDLFFGSAFDLLEQTGLTGTVQGTIRLDQRIAGQDYAPGMQVPRGTTVAIRF